MRGAPGSSSSPLLRALGLLALLSAMSCRPAADRGASGGSTTGADAGESAPSVRTETRVRCVFTEITRRAGLDFHHTSGASGSKLLPETVGAGAALFDHDDDGNLDIFFVNSTTWQHALSPASVGTVDDRSTEPHRPTCRLYRGEGGGSFRDVTAATGAGVTLYGMGCAVGDYDGDGDEDLYITALGDNVLLRNDGARFADVTASAGVAGGRWRDRSGRLHPEWSTAAVWLDADSDADLDLFVANYVEWSPEHEIFTTLDGITKAFMTPDRYDGLAPRLFLNRGDGTFEDGTARAGLDRLRGKSLGAALWDLNGDRRLDIAVANDTRPNFLFLSAGRDGFRECGLEVGIAYDDNGRARAGMGIDVADFACDGHPGVVIGNFSGEPLSLYRWAPDGSFSSDAERAGIGRPTYDSLTFGVRFEDVDLDGALDLLVVNGHIEPDIGRVSPDASYAQPPQLFFGDGDGAFVDASRHVGEDFRRPRVGRGLATGDIDGDGDLDLLLTTNGGAPALLRNDLSSPNHFLRVRLIGKAPNPRALGARVRLMTGVRTQTRFVRSGSSYVSESERTLTFGLGSATRVDRLEVRWPDGRTESTVPAELDRTIVIREGDTARSR